MRQLGQIAEGRGPELQQLLPLQVPPRPFAGPGRHAFGAMLREDRAFPWLEFAGVGRH